MAVRYKKLKKLKIQNRFLVIKKKKINKNSNLSGYRFFSRDEENSLSDENRLVGFEDMKSFHSHTHIHP